MSKVKNWLKEKPWALKVIKRVIIPLAEIYTASTKTKLDDAGLKALKIGLEEVQKP